MIAERVRTHQISITDQISVAQPDPKSMSGLFHFENFSRSHCRNVFLDARAGSERICFVCILIVSTSALSNCEVLNIAVSSAGLNEGDEERIPAKISSNKLQFLAVSLRRLINIYLTLIGTNTIGKHLKVKSFFANS